ncbi:MAG: adenylyltransferase/cytidyltransferase family protein [Pirellulales bacterium]|nr:adenylyltransferase/cytidyltransferase family protein [Pirellulales bacterium]
MACSVEDLVQRIHASPTRFVLALSGGGARALATLTGIPGASRTLLEAVVPYSSEAIVAWLGGRPDQFCSAETARRMAMAALLRAHKLADSEAPLAGVACTASLATDRPKRGPHRAHVAIQTTSFTATRSVELVKDRRGRDQEEEVVGRLLLNAVAETSGHEPALDLGLEADEPVVRAQTIAPPSWQELLLGKTETVRHGKKAGGDESLENKVLFPGAFNPIHDGHRGMARIAAELLGRPVEFEIAIVNPDKPPIDFDQMKRRTEQFDREQVVWLTRAATFVEKSRLFPGATFVVGADTLRRIADPRYYGDDAAACQAALRRIAARGCRFLVFGRNTGTGFVSLAHLDLPEPLASICREVPAEQFRVDVSSTQLRNARMEWNERGALP